MPETITLEDGSTREVPTEQELKDLQVEKEANSQLSEQFNKIKETLGLQEGETIEGKLGELKESANPNWQEARKKINALKAIAKEKGVEVDDQGNIVEKNQSLSKDDIVKTAEETFEKKTKEFKKSEVLSKFNKDDAKEVERVFDKLDSLGGSFEENMKLAVDKVFPSKGVDLFKMAINSGGGGGPRPTGKDDIKSDVKSFGMSAFGLTEEDFKRVNK